MDGSEGFTLSRKIAAPPETAFRAWTSPADLRWFDSGNAPADEEPTPIEVDLRVGGAWRQLMVVDDDTRYITGGIYREIEPGRRLVFTWGAIGGWPEIDPAHPEGEHRVTVEFTDDDDGGTLLTHTHKFLVDVSDETAQQMRAGWGQTLDRLVDAYAGVR
jgi:uncharacterized protein YndB with AHSA1/START domain